MPLSTLTELVSAIGRWAWRSDVEGETEDTTFVATIPDFIALLEKRVNRELRVGDMLKTAAVTLTDGAGSLPADYLQYRRFSEDAFPTYDFAPGGPRTGRGFNISGSGITAWPITAGPLTLEYYASVPPLTADNPTNWLLTKAPDVYLYGSLLESMGFTQDDAGASRWHAYYDKAIEDLRSQDVMARYARAGYRLTGCTP